MLRHIVMWNYKEGFTDAENQKHALRIKKELEALKTSVNEIVEMNVHINALSSSNMDIILDSSFENETTMATYKIHPEHIRVSDFIGTVLQNRTVIDYYE